ncbi:MAG: hypothetical protein HY391_04125, partial [Deltaproteobacteria bacterium]|nr:hypothetical protein [Deltaproteobacteria bacterium]
GWAGASILDPQPLKPVTVTGKNGEEVRFEIGDLMALSTESHMELLSSSAGIRNYGRNHPYEQEGLDYKTARDDINPSAFHLILANLIGVLKRSFVVDKDFGPEVWNHPVHQYKVEKVFGNFPIEKKTRDRETLSDHRAILKKYAETPLIPVYVKTTVWIISDAITPPYETTPDEKVFTKNGERVYLPRRSDPNAGGAGTTYEYILYVSADKETHGDVVDGIWFGSSRRNHPDFIWIPLANSREGWGYENPHLDEKEVRNLVLQSAQ